MTWRPFEALHRYRISPGSRTTAVLLRVLRFSAKKTITPMPIRSAVAPSTSLPRAVYLLLRCRGSRQHNRGCGADQAERSEHNRDWPPTWHPPYLRAGGSCSATGSSRRRETGREKKRDDSHADQHVVGAAHGGSGLTQNRDDDACESIHANRNPRCAKARMDPPEARRKIAIDSGNERQSRSR